MIGRMAQRAKRIALSARSRAIAATIYSIILLVSLIALFNWVIGIVAFLLLAIGFFVYKFLKVIMLIGSLNEDLRELEN